MGFQNFLKTFFNFVENSIWVNKLNNYVYQILNKDYEGTKDYQLRAQKYDDSIEREQSTNGAAHLCISKISGIIIKHEVHRTGSVK